MPEKPPNGRIVAQYVMRHACPASCPGKTISAEVYYGLAGKKRKNVIFVTNSTALTWQASRPNRALGQPVAKAVVLLNASFLLAFPGCLGHRSLHCLGSNGSGPV